MDDATINTIIGFIIYIGVPMGFLVVLAVALRLLVRQATRNREYLDRALALQQESNELVREILEIVRNAAS